MYFLLKSKYLNNVPTITFFARHFSKTGFGIDIQRFGLKTAVQYSDCAEGPNGSVVILITVLIG